MLTGVGAASVFVMNESNDFSRVESERDFERILNELKSGKVHGIGLTDDNLTWQFQILSVHERKLTLKLREPSARVLKAHEPLQFLFGLSDGQYMVKTRVEPESDQSSTFVLLGTEVFRLQRRNNFRADVPISARISLQIPNPKTPQRPHEMPAINLSAGGVRVKWSLGVLPAPQVGESVQGALNLPTLSERIDVRGVVRVLIPVSQNEVYVGIEFLDLGVDDQKTLLFLCMKLARETSAKTI